MYQLSYILKYLQQTKIVHPAFFPEPIDKVNNLVCLVISPRISSGTHSTSTPHAPVSSISRISFNNFDASSAFLPNALTPPIHVDLLGTSPA